MKLSVAIAANDALPSAFVVFRGFEKSIYKASEMGYHGVELALKSAGEVSFKELSRWLGKRNMAVSCISTGQVYASLGLSLIHPDSSIREKAVEVFGDLIRLAGDLGAAVNIGRARGCIAPLQTREDAEALFMASMEPLCKMAVSYGVPLIIEPVNRYEMNFINTLDEGARLIERLSANLGLYSNGLGLMPDTFHMNIEEAHMGESLYRNAPQIKYLHLADSNRHAPGQGHLDFKEVFSSLEKAGYKGWASIEILPVPDPETAASQAAQYILPFLSRYGLNQ